MIQMLRMRPTAETIARISVTPSVPTIAAALLLLPWPLRMMQLATRQRGRGLTPRVARASGILLMLGKLPQFLGLMSYYMNRSAGRASSLIEYKRPEIKS